MSAFQAGEHQESSRTSVDIAVPIYNESRDLEASVRTLRRYLDQQFPFPALVTIVDNASTDGSWEIATRLADTIPGVRALHLDLKGRGRALRAAWSASDAEVVVYMDVDLSTGLDALLPLVAPLVSGHGDVAIGSRLAHGARVFRGPKREVISRLYNLILRVVLHSRFSDAQCGFKAMRSADARAILPLVADNEWFFDTELLVVAERAGLRISEVPVDWSDDPNTSVHIANTARKDLQGVWRMLRSSHRDLSEARVIRSSHLPAALDELVRTSRLGVAGSVAYLVLLLVSTQFVTVSVANLAALALAIAVGATSSSRSAGRHRRGMDVWPRAAGVGLLFITSALATTIALGIAVLMGASPLGAGLAAATVGMSAAVATRFVLCRSLVFRAYLGAHRPGPSDPTGQVSTAGRVPSTTPTAGQAPSPTLHAAVLPSPEADLLARR